MIRKVPTILFLILWLASIVSTGQSIESLREQIHSVIEDRLATVGVAISGVAATDTLTINGDLHLPMQSVFKYHLALAVLHQVDQGVWRLSQDIELDQALIDTYRHLWSPLRKKYPEGGQVALSEILEYTVAWSDNMGCDVLFKLIGGTGALQAYLRHIGIADVAVVHTELSMQAHWMHQYDNWITAKAANLSLALFLENTHNLLSAESHSFLLNTLKATQTGKKSIKGLLPIDTVVAHKTGHSGKNSRGMTGAVNDIGVVFLPDNSYFYLSVLVSDSMESDDTNQMIIAQIAQIAWSYFSGK